MTVALSLPLLSLSDDEASLVGDLRRQISFYARRNRFRADLYEGKHKAENLDISCPPQLRDLAISVGWPGIVVDILEERLDFQGWTSPQDDLGLGEIFSSNHLGVESGRGHLDALITGTDFVTCGRGFDGEPEIVVSVESAESCTANWDYRRRRVSAALSQTRDNYGSVILETLYLPKETIHFEKGRDSTLVVAERDRHNLGRPPVSRLVNRDRASDVDGRSEITRPVIYLTDAGLRTLLGMEINREFYTAPQRYALNADPEDFGVGEESSLEDRIRAGWSAAMGRLNIVPSNDDGNAVQMGQFNPAPPTPYIEQMKFYSQMVSAETGIPSEYFGFVSDNPSSADAIRQHENRLVKRAERRQTSFGLGWLQTAFNALMIRDKSVNPEAFRQVSVKWRDAATPTRAAAADEMTKNIASGAVPASSSVVLDRLGFTPTEQAQIKADRRTAVAREALSTLASQVKTDPEVKGLAERRGDGSGSQSTA